MKMFTNKRLNAFLIATGIFGWIALAFMSSKQTNVWVVVGVAWPMPVFGGLCFLAIEANDTLLVARLLAAGVSGYLATWSMIYRWLSSHDAGAFSEALGRLDAAYFALATFSTTGYGDIAARSQAARIAVTLNMAGNLGVVGVAVTLALAKMVGRKGPAARNAD
jgi:hypothetical protein